MTMLRLAPVLVALAAQVAFAQGAAPDGNWTMPAHDYAGTRFSPLDETTFAESARACASLRA